MESTLFDHKKLLSSLLEFTAKIQDPSLDSFLEINEEMSKIFQNMGGAMAMAFEDIADKARIIRKNIPQLREKKSFLGLYSGMDAEIILGVHILNGENWNELGNNNEYFKNYESIARTVVRLAKFFNFVLILLTNLFTNRSKLSSSCCSDAYSKAFGKYHKFYIRTAAKAAMLLAPSRKNMLNLFIGKEDEKVAYECIEECVILLEIAFASIDQYINERKISDLP